MLLLGSSKVPRFNEALAHVGSHQKIIGVLFNSRSVIAKGLNESPSFPQQEAAIGQNSIVKLIRDGIQHQSRGGVSLCIGQFAYRLKAFPVTQRT